MVIKTSRRTLLASGVAGLGALALPRFSTAQTAVAKPVFGSNGAAATSQPLATAAALHILQNGGSAVDAAIAAAAMLGLTEPLMSGPGGDLFAQVYDPHEGRLFALDSAGATGTRFSLEDMQSAAGSSDMPKHGSHSVSIPGAIAGWFALHERFGKLGMDQILAPAIAAAKAGFPVGVQTSTDWQSAKWLNRSAPGVVGDFSEFDAVFQPDGKTPRPGEQFQNAAYAASLEIIRDAGTDAVYGDGPIARAILSALGEEHAIGAQDLAGHEAVWRTPLSTHYRGAEIFQLPPPGQGVSTLQILALLDAFDIGSMEFSSPERLHLLMEATKIAYRDRAAVIGDGASVEVLAPERLAMQCEEIDLERASGDVDVPLQDGDTSYLSVADHSGMMVSLITSVSGPFGSGIVAAGTGFCLQNRAAGFNLIPGHANAFAPGKRPFHTIIPGFAMRDGAPWLAFGVMGGAMQPQGQAQILSAILDHGDDIQAAGHRPRLRLYGGPQPETRTVSDPVWRIEHGFPDDTLEALRAKGHRIELGLPNPYVRYGGYQCVERRNGAYAAATEPRNDGVALAY